MGDVVLRDILVIFAVAVPVVLLAHRLKFPSIVGFLVTGFIIGPYTLGLIPNIEEIKTLTEIGVALLLFSIGLEFSFDRLKGWGRTIIGMGSVQIVATTAVGFGAGRLIGWNTAESVLLGFTVSLSSTAIVMAVLSQKRWFDAPAGRIATGVLILQDIAVIPMMVFLKLAFFPNGGLPAEGAMAGGDGTFELAIAAAKLLGLVAAIIVLSRWILGPLLHYISKPRSKELFVVVIVGLAIGASYITEKLGLSFALGAFLAGLIVSTTEFRFHALSEIAPFRYCFNGLFFVAVGMIVNPLFIAEHVWTVLLLLVFMLFVKAIVVAISIMLFGYPPGVAVISALMLAQVGEFSFMLVFFGWQAGVVDFKFYQLLVDASAISMVLAPFIVALAPKIGEKLAFITWRMRPIRGKWLARVPDEEEKLSGHAIICGFGPLGMTVGKLLEKQKIPYVVLELNPVTAMKIKALGGRVYVGDGASSALLHHSGIETARLLAIAVPDQLNAMAIVGQARKMNSEISIITRSRYRDQVQAFYDAGADIVICEELEGGIEMGRYILMKLGFAGDEISRLFKEIREFGSADFF